ncbi:MAG: FHA domain-containing protein [Planctomycetaceae bacterium]|nr:FHA domain-containing protein [Planctomycetaceae bacterium]
MGSLTFQIIDGLEAGQVLRDLETPVTIGREEDNDIRLNDERVSRFHAKIQSDGDKYILTDLESTNGTRVNGHPVRMRLLSVGDQVHIGRCVLVFGSPEQLKQEIATGERELQDPSTQSDIVGREDGTHFPDAYPAGPPALPEGLTPTQTVELTNLLDYVRTEVLSALYQTDEAERPATPKVQLPRPAWHRLQRLPLWLAQQLEGLANPNMDRSQD